MDCSRELREGEGSRALSGGEGRRIGGRIGLGTEGR